MADPYDPARVHTGRTRSYLHAQPGVHILAWHPSIAPDRPLYSALLCT